MKIFYKKKIYIYIRGKLHTKKDEKKQFDGKDLSSESGWVILNQVTFLAMDKVFILLVQYNIIYQNHPANGNM